MAETEVEEKNRGGAMAGFGRLVAGASKASLLKRLEKMRAAVKEQSARVLCVCDFDHTISAYHLYDEASRLAGKGDDTKSLSSHSIVENAGLLGEAFREESKRRFEKYYPLETNPRLGIGERQKICEQWWGESHDAIISAGFTRGMVAQAVEATSSSIRMREGAADFFALFQSKEEEEARRRELIVFSAGLGNVIQQIVSFRVNRMRGNVRVERDGR